VRLFGYSDSEALVAATRTGAAAMMLEGQTGEITKGFLADLLVVAGAPQDDVRLLNAPANIKLVMKDGRIYKNLFETRH
jgi:imidazolonepropionase-like amidohydrolase